jgi:multicomponent Na+:H+ antiporter subunit D
MTLFTILWISLPFLVGFGIYLLPQLDRVLTLAVTLVSMAYAAALFLQAAPLDLHLLDTAGVTLLADRLSGFFLLTNALVTAAVILYCWHQGKTSFFYIQTILLHGSLNAAFICADLISLYVALEVIGITAFLLIAYPRSDRSLWVALRYLFISNTAMLFYLIGAALVYQAQQTFAFTGLRGAPVEAQALVIFGLLVKGGIFVSGLWLPQTHSEAESQVSALLSGVVVKAGVFPLVRLALLVDSLDPVVRLFGVAAAVLGVLYALTETDTKRVLACSTLSQVGWIMAIPEAAGFYALAHGLGKAALFLVVGQLPSRDLGVLRQRGIDTALWLPLTLGSLSIAGFPFFAGFSAKMLTLKQGLPWQVVVLNGAAVGTAILYAKFVFLPHRPDGKANRWAAQPGLGMALILLLGALLIANLVYLDAYALGNVVKALTIVGLGCLIHWLGMQRVSLSLPRTLERFDHLLGSMSVVLLVLLWMTWAWIV